jgi:flagella synthesis protein FlgN
MNASRMDSTQLVATLDTILLAEEAAAGVLLCALEAEAEALKGRDAATLTLATEEKVEALEKLESIEQERRDFCARIGAGPGQAGMDAWLAAYAGSGGQATGLRERWTSLTELLRRCREINQANGLVVASLQRRVQQALSLMRTGSTEPPAYRPEEATAAAPSPVRTIARA